MPALLCLITCIVWAQPAQKTTTEEYINLYKQVAVEEMYRTGIPASIKLAQGILESGSGNSRLAREANNHFGIKCHREWTGESVREDDDAPDECFRKYDDAVQSYLDHSAFLTTRDRYAGLFTLERTDYKGWAHGLKQAGYATNPQYAPLLIGVIERYGLHQYDFADPAALTTETTDNESEEPVVTTTTASLPVFQRGVFETNRIKTVFLQHGETLADIAAANAVSERLLARWNETDRGALEPGMKVYLQPKRSKGATSYHRVAEGETMYRIAQTYGIRLDELCARNLMTAGTEPAAGERLYLRKKRTTPPTLRPAVQEVPEQEVQTTPEVSTPNPEPTSTTESSPEVTPVAETVEVTDPPAPDAKKQVATPEPTMPVEPPRYVYQGGNGDTTESADLSEALTDELPETAPATVPYVEMRTAPSPPTPALILYTVEQGQTLYSLSRQFQVTVEQLRQWNDLPDNTIRIGQSLIVGGME